MSAAGGTAPAAPRGAAARVLVIALDGVPCSGLRAALAAGRMPRLAALAARGSLRPIVSVHPTVSSCAWASFMAGTGPGGHGLYGFVDRRPGSGDLFIPTGRDIAAETLWEKLSRLGKRVLVINVPGTWPPREVNGTIVAGFLCTDLEKIAREKRVVDLLRSLDYRIDVDAWRAHDGAERVLPEAEVVMDRRAAAALRLIESETWDFAMVHFMELDRMQHFLWRQAEAGEPRAREGFDALYARVDGHIGSLVDACPPGTEVVALSDHGFCSIKREVQVNRWLEEQGWLTLRDDADPRSGPRGIDPAGSVAWSLIPGRIYLNLRGRERDGSVAPGPEADALRRAISERLLDWRDDDGSPVVRAVFRADEVYAGAHVGRAPDLVAWPSDGYDLKGRFGVPTVWDSSPLSGMHTFDDAFLLLSDRPAPDGADFSVVDAHRVICAMLGVDPRPRSRAA